MDVEQCVREWTASAEPLPLARLRQTIGGASASLLGKKLAWGYLIAHAKLTPGAARHEATLTIGDLARLDAVGGSTESWVFPLRPSGRGAFSEFISVGRTPNNDVIIPDATVSKLHAVLREHDEALTLVDAGSHNGTFVDGKKVPPKQHAQAIALYDGARLRFGSVEVLFVSSGGLAKLLAAAPPAAT